MCPAVVVEGVEVCRSGEGVWDSAGNGAVGWHVRCVLMHHSVCGKVGGEGWEGWR